MPTDINLLTSPAWVDYELLDSGSGLKLERFGAHTLLRPEVQALWSKALPESKWREAHAVFHPTAEESGGHWEFKTRIPEKWEMQYRDLKFWAMTTPGRHLGVFPECAAHWDWLAEKIKTTDQTQANVLNLFGYTGLASLAAARAGAKVTHVDASKKAITWARENQDLSGLSEKPIRWIVDDAVKFVQREARRGVKYSGILLDPPKFGRGPKGEIWEVYKSLPELMNACREVLSNKPLFVITTVYAVKASALHIYNATEEMMKGFGGSLECGELVTREKSAGRLLSQAVYGRWSA